MNKKADVRILISQKSNLLISVAKLVDFEVIRVEIVEHWQRLKVHSMLLKRYLEERKMELLKREIELGMGIQLKAIFCWLISKKYLREQQENSNKQRSAIIITISGKSKVKMLFASRLYFGGQIKIVEKYWESGPSSVYLTYCSINHE